MKKFVVLFDHQQSAHLKNIIGMKVMVIEILNLRSPNRDLTFPLFFRAQLLQWDAYISTLLWSSQVVIFQKFLRKQDAEHILANATRNIGNKRPRKNFYVLKPWKIVNKFQNYLLRMTEMKKITRWILFQKHAPTLSKLQRGWSACKDL